MTGPITWPRIALFLALTKLSAVTGAAQCASLRERIPKADIKKYRAVRDASDWRNPYSVVHRSGIEVVGFSPTGKTTPVTSICEALEHLPGTAWPYGLVVAVQDASVQGRGDSTYIEKNRKKLAAILEESHIVVELWPS